MSDMPKGENGLSSRSMHIQRRKFVRKAYPLLDKRNGIDLWYGPKSLYGKVNTRNVPQLLSETNLKSILSSPELFAVDFVVDAFEDLRRFISRASRRRVIFAQDSFMGLMNAKLAWRSAREEYDQHIRDIHEVFVSSYLIHKNRSYKILTIEDFLDLYIDHARTIGRMSPITFGGYIKSKYVNHAISGLIIELNTFSYDNDSLKFKRFYESDHFNFYQNAARKHGFRVDYNSPWRLVADITSPEMQKYMSNYRVNNPEELFFDYYYDAYRLEVYMIKKYLVQFYNDYASGNPIVKRVVSGRFDRPEIKAKIKYRQQIKESEVDEKYSNLFWLKFYLDLREAELSKPMTRQSKNKKIMEMAHIMKTLDFTRALDYINRELMILERG